MSTRRLTVTAVAVSCAVAGLLALGSVPSLAAFKTTYLRQLDGANTPAEHFERLSPKTVTVDDFTGDTLVADTLAVGVVQVFDPLGNYLTTWDGSNTPAKSFGAGEGFAVAANNASGEIYVTDNRDGVVDVLDSSGNYLATWNGSNTPAGSFGGLGSAAVDQATGRVYVPDLSHQVIDVFDSSGTYLSQISSASTPLHSFGEPRTLSVTVDDVTGDVLVAASGGQPLIYVFDATGHYLATWEGLNTPAGSFSENNSIDVSVNDATGDVLVADQGHSVIDVFDSSGDYLPPQITGAEAPAGSWESVSGVAIDQATGQIYVSSREQLKTIVSVFSAAVIPAAIAGVPSSLQPTSVTLNGKVDPYSMDVVQCQFEYGTDATFGQSVPCAQTTAQIGKGAGPVAVSADVSGLQPDTLYHFRLSAANANGVSVGQEATLFTSTAPLIEGVSAADVGSATASVGAQINAAGLSSTYRVEYGSSAAYGSSTPEASLGNTESAQPVLARLSGLQPDSEYHYRFVATNALGTTTGGDTTFRTSLSSGASGSSLPDSRVYELVSPPSGEDWDVYTPQLQCEVGEAVCSGLPVQASSDGDSIAFVGDPVPGGSGSTGNDLGNEFLASRASAGDWSSSVITPTGVFLLTGVYSGFSSDLSVGVLSSRKSEPLTPEAPANCNGVYSRTSSDGRLHALFTKAGNPGEACEAPRFGGASTDGSRIAFEMPAALTAEAPGKEEPNLYESTAGQLHLINVLPDGKPAANAAFGSGSPHSLLLSGVVSADGSRIFWTDLSNHNLYVREGGGTPQARTVQVDSSIGGGGEYWAASSDGSLVFFTKEGDLYSFDVETGQTSDLASGSEVQGVIGVSDDGSYVYFVANAALKDAEGKTLKSSRGQEPVLGEENLYVAHAGTSRFIATLAEGDSSDWLSHEGIGPGTLGENAAASVNRTAEVAPSGHGVVFTSKQSLTGYDNQSAGEVYVYSAAGDTLNCASCSPTGAPVIAHGGALSLPTDNTHLPRWINAAGTQVFFNSAEPLLPQDTSGKTQVYEWEQKGTGGCQQGGGCIHLLSGGTGAEAVFMDASTSGSDVFFATRSQLVPQDQSDNTVLYDARENGYSPISQPACTGSGCQGVPPAPPIFATPSSVTFNGVGNYQPAQAVSKPKSKPKRCKRGLVKRHGRCVRQKANRPGKREKKGSK